MSQNISGCELPVVTVDDWQKPSNLYQCRVRICPDEAGGFFAVALNLPGAVSDGETMEEAIRNIREACAAAIESYKAIGAIPWGDVDAEDRPGSRELLVSVNG